MQTAASSDAAVCFFSLLIRRKRSSGLTNHLQSPRFEQTLRPQRSNAVDSKQRRKGMVDDQE